MRMTDSIMTISSKIRCFSIPILLCIVAMNHCWRYASLQQSSWGAGCGFGMFATVDYHGTRFLRGWLKSGDVEEPAGFRSNFAELDLQSRVLPSERNLRRYAAALADAEWKLELDPQLLPVTTNGTPIHHTDRCFALHTDSRDTPLPHRYRSSGSVGPSFRAISSSHFGVSDSSC